MFEISFGVAMFFIGFGYFVPKIAILPDTFSAILFLRIFFVVIGIAGFFWLSRKFKKKYIWEKTGYSAPADNSTKTVKILLFAGFLFYISAILSRRFLFSETTIMLTGFAVAFAYIALFFQSGKVSRFLAFSVLAIGIAGVTVGLNIFYSQAIYLMILIMGCISIASGITVYVGFKKKLIQ